MKSIYRNVLTAFMLMVLPLGLWAQSNQYLHFDKVDDFVQHPTGSQFIQNATAFSMTGWFYTDALAYGQGMMGFRGTGGGFYLIQLDNGKLESRFVNSANVLFEVVGPANTIIPQMWQHIAWVYDGTAIKLYINGVLKGSKAANGTITSGTIPFAIGKSLLGGFNFVFGGRADEVTVWTKGLTQQEIQDMMVTEPVGNEPDLQLYYKFNQGVPGGDNTSITKLISEVGGAAREADLMNFALNGATSNFGGTLNPGFQAISFPQIAPKLTTDVPFAINATASSGLTVNFEIVSGPATINGNMVTLSGTPGEVVVKATQPGGGTWTPAAPVTNTFMVYDPATHTPDIDIRNPLDGDLRMPSLKPFELAAIATITVPELFNVTGLNFSINGTNIQTINHGNNHYTGWWTPPAYGTYTLTVTSSNNYSYTSTETVTFNVIPDTLDTEVIACEGVWLNTDNPSIVVDAELPSFLGAFDKIMGTLIVSCPNGGCGEWDRVASIDAKGHDGQWHEIIRYITPYGVACSHAIDLTDYMSILSGKISFRLNCATLDNGYLYKIKLNYSAGYPAHTYSTINQVWWETYPFGDYANTQPVPAFNFSFPDNSVAAKLKLVSTGHGWGTLNTGNAAEFYNATHHVIVNNDDSLVQHNWYVCNPNPDGCQPQNGTWYHNRAGWCPGAIAQWYDYDLTTYIPTENMELKYRFYPNYMDMCHPNHPACVTGVTCSNCLDGFNPHLIVACNLVVFADNPITQGIEDRKNKISAAISVYPNPTSGIIHIHSDQPEMFKQAGMVIFTPEGNVVEQKNWNGDDLTLDLTTMPKGVYFLKVQTPDGVGMKKFLVL